MRFVKIAVVISALAGLAACSDGHGKQPLTNLAQVTARLTPTPKAVAKPTAASPMHAA